MGARIPAGAIFLQSHCAAVLCHDPRLLQPYPHNPPSHPRGSSALLLCGGMYRNPASRAPPPLSPSAAISALLRHQDGGLHEGSAGKTGREKRPVPSLSGSPEPPWGLIWTVLPHPSLGWHPFSGSWTSTLGPLKSKPSSPSFQSSPPICWSDFYLLLVENLLSAFGHYSWLSHSHNFKPSSFIP